MSSRYLREVTRYKIQSPKYIRITGETQATTMKAAAREEAIHRRGRIFYSHVLELLNLCSKTERDLIYFESYQNSY